MYNILYLRQRPGTDIYDIVEETDACVYSIPQLIPIDYPTVTKLGHIY